MNEAAKLGSAIKQAAEETGSLVVEAAVEVRGDTNTPLVRVSTDEAVKVVSASAPRLIYVIEQIFDFDSEIEALREELDELNAQLSPDRLSDLRNRFVEYDSQIGATIASFMVDGVLHQSFSTAGWHDEFSDAAATIVEGAREEAEASRSTKRSAEGDAIERKAVALANHPSFNYGRVSFDKRFTLAKALFKNSDTNELSEITRRAENLFWLEQSGVNLDIT